MRGSGVVMVLVVGLLACGGSGPPPAAPGAADPGPACAEVAASILDKMVPAARRNPEGSQRVTERVRRLCVVDGWTLESRRCFVGAPRDAVRQCMLQLTEAQRSALVPPPPPPPPPRPDSGSAEATARSDSWDERMTAWRAAMDKWEQEKRVQDALPESQRGPMPPPPVPPPPPPPPPPPSQNVAPMALEAYRIAGTKYILPDDPTKVAISQSGKDKLLGVYKLCITAEGNIASVVALKTTGFPAYDEKIMSTIRGEWRYQPFVVNGVPTPVCTTVTFIYSQKPPPPPPPPVQAPPANRP